MSQINIRHVIKQGDTVYTQCNSYDEWIPNIIIDVQDNLIKIELKDYYFRKGVMVGDYISIRYTFSNQEYVLEGEINEIDIYNTYTISIFINTINIYKNRRKHFRYYARLGSSLKSSQDDKGTYSIVTNISLSGLALISKLNKSIGDNVFIDLFKTSEVIIPINGIIVRKRALNYGYEYGIIFRDINSSTQKQLDSLINYLENRYE